jgi:hypothetical protein
MFPPVSLTSAIIQMVEKPNPALFFVAFDMADFNAFAEVINTFENSTFLVMGTARQKANEMKLKVKTLEDFDIKELVDSSWPREQGLKEEDIQKIASQIQVNLVVIGVASKIQQQIGEAYKKQDIHVAAFWDNFNLNPNTPYGKTAIKVQAIADQVFVPSSAVAKALDSNTIQRCTVVESPAFVKFKREVEKQISNQKLLLEQYNLDPQKVICSYFGSADIPQYPEKALPLFINCLQQLSVESCSTQWIVMPHPKVKANEFEPKQLTSLKNIDKLLIAPEQMTNEKAIALSDVVVCYNSSLGDFSHYLNLGKTVVFIVPPHDPYENLLAKQGAVYQVSTAEEFLKIMQKIWNQKQVF